MATMQSTTPAHLVPLYQAFDVSIKDIDPEDYPYVSFSDNWEVSVNNSCCSRLVRWIEGPSYNASIINISSAFVICLGKFDKFDVTGANRDEFKKLKGRLNLLADLITANGPSFIKQTTNPVYHSYLNYMDNYYQTKADVLISAKLAAKGINISHNLDVIFSHYKKTPNDD